MSTFSSPMRQVLSSSSFRSEAGERREAHMRHELLLYIKWSCSQDLYSLMAITTPETNETEPYLPLRYWTYRPGRES